MSRVPLALSVICLLPEELPSVIALAEALLVVEEFSGILGFSTRTPPWGFRYMGLCMLTGRPLSRGLFPFPVARVSRIGPWPARLRVPIRTRVVPLRADDRALPGLMLIERDDLLWLPLLKHGHHVHHTLLECLLELSRDKGQVRREERLRLHMLDVLGY